MKLYATTCGWLTGDLGNFLAGEEGRLRVPVPSYLIDHPKGRLLFDSGLHVDVQTDPHGRLGPAARVFDVEFAPGEEISARLAACDVDAADITWLVNSHLHFDHTGGNAQIPNATLVIQQREWQAGHDPDQIRSNFFDPRDYDLGHDVLEIDGEHDVFGDGRVMCLPTYGHTPGHQSLLVRLDHGDVVLAADSCYLRRTLEELHLPSVLDDADEMLSSLETLRTLRDAGAHVFYGHDPELWEWMPQAPREVTLSPNGSA